MSEGPPVKRRRVDPTLSKSPRNGDSDLVATTTFRRYLACFLLVSPMTGATRPERQRRRYTYASTGILDSSAKKSPLARRLLDAGPSRLLRYCPDDMEWMEYVHQLVSSEDLDPEFEEQIDRMVKLCLEGYEEAYLKGHEPENSGEKKNPVYRPSAFSRGSGILRSTQTGDQVLRYLLRLYGIRSLKKFVSGKVLGCTDQMAKEFVGFGRESLINSLVEMYRTGTLPLARRAEEGRVLEEMDVNDLRFDLCGVSVPLDLMRLIMTFLRHDYELITGVGLISWDFYVLVLLTWQEVDVKKKTLFMIPNIVFRVVPEILMCPSGKSLLMKELSYVFDHFSRENLKCLRMSIPRDSKYLPCRRRFGLLWKSVRVTGKLMGLRKFSLWVHSTEVEESWRSVRLVEVAPNLECVENPFWLDWCEGLTRLQSLATGSHVLHSCDSPLLDAIAASVSELEVIRWNYRRKSVVRMDCSSQFEALLPRLSSLTLKRGAKLDMDAILRYPSPNLETLSIALEDWSSVDPGDGLAQSPNLRFLHCTYGGRNPAFAIQMALARPVLGHLTQIRLWKTLESGDSQTHLRELGHHVPHLDCLQVSYFGRRSLCLDVRIRNRGHRVHVKVLLGRLSAQDVCLGISRDMTDLLSQQPPSSYEIAMTLKREELEVEQLDEEFEIIVSSLMGSIESSYQSGRDGLMRDSVVSFNLDEGKYEISGTKSLVWHRREE